MATALSQRALGSIVKIKENGVAQEFFVAKHGYPVAGNGRTLLVRRYIDYIQVWSTANVNAYASSNIDKWLTQTYLTLLPADIVATIDAVSIPYTPGNGNNTVGSLSRKVFLLSVTELGLANSNANVEGTALDIASSLRIAYSSEGNAEGHWTRSPNTSSRNGAWGLGINNVLDGGFGSTSPNGARPAFTLPSSLTVEDNGNVSVNTLPVINYSGGTTLGEQTEGFVVNYSVLDSDGDVVTVTEKLDGIPQRIHTPTLGATQQFQSVLPNQFQTILNGAHTISIEATDGKATCNPVNITFTKTVHSCRITLKEPLPASEPITRLVMNVLRSIPTGAGFQVQVSNNALDDSPVWEDATASVLNGRNHLFANTVAERGPALNFIVTASRGDGGEGGYIAMIGGAFE